MSNQSSKKFNLDLIRQLCIHNIFRLKGLKVFLKKLKYTTKVELILLVLNESSIILKGF